MLNYLPTLPDIPLIEVSISFHIFFRKYHEHNIAFIFFTEEEEGYGEGRLFIKYKRNGK